MEIKNSTDVYHYRLLEKITELENKIAEHCDYIQYLEKERDGYKAECYVLRGLVNEQ